MSLFLFLTVLQAIVAAALVGVILMQRSEGGGLGVGGSPSGFMSARGAADFLTRSTAILAGLFVLLSIVLAGLAVDVTSGRDLDTTLERGAATPAVAPAEDPLAGADGASPAGDAAAPAPAAGAPAESSDDPLAGAAGE
jgi:preprotein translocase subunit SecG